MFKLLAVLLAVPACANARGWHRYASHISESGARGLFITIWLVSGVVALWSARQSYREGEKNDMLFLVAVAVDLFAGVYCMKFIGGYALTVSFLALFALSGIFSQTAKLFKEPK